MNAITRAEKIEATRSAWQDYESDAESVDNLAALLDALETLASIAVHVTNDGTVTIRDTA